MRTTRLRVAYIHNLQNTFVRIDEEILRKRYDVNSYYIHSRNIKSLLETWRAIKAADVIVAWFASWHSLPAFAIGALYHIPRILITGGYDVANEPEISYGLRRGGVSYIVSDAVFRLASLSLPFSEAAYQETLNNTPINVEKLQVLPLGVPDSPAYAVPHMKEKIAITVGGINSVSVKRKGIKEFVATARYLPDIRFIVVGKHTDNSINDLRAAASPNVEFTDFLPDKDLDALLQMASVYVQPSYHEGFGLAVAQSMLARCVPVVSRRGSLPEVVGDAGIYVDEITPVMIANRIKEALSRQTEFGEKARQRVLQHFSIEQRAEGLYSAIDQLVIHQRKDNSK